MILDIFMKENLYEINLKLAELMRIVPLGFPAESRDTDWRSEAIEACDLLKELISKKCD